MDCSYCKKDMADSDICPSCGMGKRVDFELFKTDKAERQKDYEEYERNYLNKSNGTEETPEKVKEESSISKTTRHIQNNDILPSKESAGQKVVGYGIVAAIVIGLGILTGVLLRAASP
jgi:hypothetical protein